MSDNFDEKQEQQAGTGIAQIDFDAQNHLFESSYPFGSAASDQRKSNQGPAARSWVDEIAHSDTYEQVYGPTHHCD